MKVRGVFSMNRDAIKMFAMFTMLLNHIANALLPAGQPLTNLFLFIGYFTAVTMCYFLVEGYGYTRSKRNYAARLLVFALLSQLPYQLAFPDYGMAEFVQLNMLFTLLLCFLVLLVQEKVHRQKKLPLSTEFLIFQQEIFSAQILRTELNLERKRRLIWIRDFLFRMNWS